MGFINTESFCRFSRAIKAIQSFCLCICVSLFHENKVLLCCSMLIKFSQMNRPFVIRLLKYSSYCSWVRKPSVGKNLQIACCVWAVAGQTPGDCCSATQLSTAGNLPSTGLSGCGYWAVGTDGWHCDGQKKFVTGRGAGASSSRGNAALQDQ